MEEKKILEDGVATINSEEDIAKLKEEIKEEVIADNAPTNEQNELFKKVMEEASMPVEMTDKDFKLGDNELDIRKLNPKNTKQMMFRQGVLQNVYLKQIMTSLIDITRLLMVVCDHIGVEDIVGATDDVIEKVAEKNQELKEVLDKAKDKNDNKA